MILAVDSSALILLVNPAANPPEDPETNKPVAHARERIELFLAGLTASDTLIIPTPVLAEVLVGAEDGGPGLLEAISGMARVKVRPFGERAAVETAMMTREAIAAGDKRGGSEAPWQKVKVDRQVVAVARAESATRIYADDHNLVEFARRLGMDVFSTWDLPLPEGFENLFTAAGVPMEPAEDRGDADEAGTPADAALEDVGDDPALIDAALRNIEAAAQEHQPKTMMNVTAPSDLGPPTDGAGTVASLGDKPASKPVSVEQQRTASMTGGTRNETQPNPNLSTEPGEKGKAPNASTETQSAPNLSTEHQKEGDARSPSDTLDRGQ